MHERRIKGLIAIFLLLAIIPFIIFFSNSFIKYKVPAFSDQDDSKLTVEVVHHNNTGGVYFVKPGTSANQLLQMAGFAGVVQDDFTLETGMKLKVNAHGTKYVSVEEIGNSRRLALGIKIDLNCATKDDLLLIPGLGEITVNNILKLRNGKNGFKNMDELMEIEGIKDKKLAKLKQYLYIKKQ
ncbi:MAG TPA: helix-hairpin-helix domain-containing protein [Smithellaceae bacterium]|nr:helix-hairpin-helix domain-containing protein [Smithellaceae bacterium]